MSNEDERYDRLESLGEWREDNDIPNVWDDDYWAGVLDAPEPRITPNRRRNTHE